MRVAFPRISASMKLLHRSSPASTVLAKRRPAEDIEATIYSALGIDYTTIRRDDPFGRGFEYVPQSGVADAYAPIQELWG